MEYGFGLDYVKKFKDLDPVKIGKEAAHRACQLLGAKVIKSQKIPLVLDPEIAAELLEVLVSPLTAEAVQKGKSLFLGKLEKSAAADKLTVIDHGRMENGLGTVPFDDEGVPTQETRLIEKGILKNYLFNTYTANKGGAKSTGNASRASFMSTPDTGPTNLYISPGSRGPKSIVSSVKKGLYVTRVMGIHTANPISGDFSFGAAGIMIENGEKTHAVRGITMAGNLIEILMHIEEAGSDLRFFGSVGSPSLLIGGVSVSGS
jgi:PmbA protein